tara:strand:- start:173 stop:343 length:171 start_codon:yes stop_codon:yes gene_type:complete
MSPEYLREAKKQLEANKRAIACKVTATRDKYIDACLEYAAADMALKEFERKHGGAE